MEFSAVTNGMSIPLKALGDTAHTIVDIAVPEDSNVLQKETEKYEKYQDLARENKRIWKSGTKVVPVVVGELDSVSKKLAGHLEQSLWKLLSGHPGDRAN